MRKAVQKVIFAPPIIVGGSEQVKAVVVKKETGDTPTFFSFIAGVSWSYAGLYREAEKRLGEDLKRMGGFRFNVEFDITPGTKNRTLKVWGGCQKTGQDPSGAGRLILAKHYGLIV